MTDSIAQEYASRHAYILSKLAEMRGRWPVVASGSGVSIRTISKIARQEIKNPRLDIVDDLTRYFREQEAGQRIAS